MGSCSDYLGKLTDVNQIADTIVETDTESVRLRDMASIIEHERASKTTHALTI